MMNDLMFRMAMVRKLQAMSSHFGALMAEDCNAMSEKLPKKELEGFLHFSLDEFLWAFGAKRPSELDPFTREGVAILCTVHRGEHSAADLFVVASSIAHVLYEHATPKRYEPTQRREKAQRELHSLVGKTAPITFSEEDIEAMVADIQRAKLAS
jgi:hypothetical protein